MHFHEGPRGQGGQEVIRFAVTLCLMAVILGTSGSAWANSIEIAKAARLAQDRGDIDGAIRLYSEAIIAGDLSSENLAIAYNNRGIANWTKGELDSAISDYGTALRLQPDYAEAYHNRGMAYYFRGQYEKAIADYDAAIRINTGDAFAYENRGRAKFQIGPMQAAVADLAKAVALDPADSYAVLWLHLAWLKGGQNDTAEFAKNVGKLDRVRWPEPILEFYLDATSLEKIHAVIAASKDADTVRVETCEASFYIGSLELLRGRHDQGKQLLQKAAAECPTNFVEFAAAKAALGETEHQ